MTNRRYLIRRTLLTVFLLWLVLTFLFFFIRSLPGEFTNKYILEGTMSPETVAAIRAHWGLDQPLHVQYWRFLVNYVQGDAGTSMNTNQPVFEMVQLRILNSFILVAPAITLAYLIGSAIGGVMGNRRGSLLERWSLPPIIFLGSFPEFITAIFLIFIFAGVFDLFPAAGMISSDLTIELGPDAPWWRPYFTLDFLHHYILPFSVVLGRYLFFPTLLMRTNVIEVKGQDFFFYHRLTGLPHAKQLFHLFKHASLPVITLYPISMTRAVGGLVIVETVFSWPGIGYLLVTSVFIRDFPVVVFVLFLIGALVIIANFVVDIVYSFIDPRIELD